jgi:uncharacterized protein (TIGR00106 family)
VVGEEGFAMLAELSILPLGSDDSHLSDELAEVLKLVDGFGLPHQLTPSGTCIEGEWNEVIELIHQCHNRVRAQSSHVVTLIKIEDEEERIRQVDSKCHLSRAKGRDETGESQIRRSSVNLCGRDQLRQPPSSKVKRLLQGREAVVQA